MGKFFEEIAPFADRYADRGTIFHFHITTPAFEIFTHVVYIDYIGMMHPAKLVRWQDVFKFSQVLRYQFFSFALEKYFRITSFGVYVHYVVDVLKLEPIADRQADT